MQHIIKRCKHCNKEYTYCTYGNGPYWGTEEHCSMDYCGTCQKAINDALSKIPEKYSYKMEIVPNEDIDYINKMFVFEKQQYEKEVTAGQRFATAICIIENNYETMDGCYIDHIYYTRGVKKNGDVEIKQSMEYDLLNKTLTGKRYRFHDKPRHQYKPLCVFHPLKTIVEKPLEPPMGKVFFDIPEWELITNQKNNNEDDNNENDNNVRNEKFNVD